MPESMADFVFEGGGVKGIGLVGAYSVLAERYKPANVAGTSAGAIVAALVAAGYSGPEMQRLMRDLDYTKFKDKGVVDRVPLFGPLISILSEDGIYEGVFVERWIRDLLRDKGITEFGQLKTDDPEERYRYKLNVITADITNGRLVVLPQGIARYGLEPDRFEVARAVRMSMSIPIFFEPVVLAKSYFVDGGLLSNFPIWLFDSVEPPAWPTFGVKLMEPDDGKPRHIDGPVDFIKAIISTMLEAHDKLHVEDEDIPRTIGVCTDGVGTTEFDISDEKKERLFRNGVDAATKFLAKWNFEAYKQKFRVKRDTGWVEKVTRMKQRLVF